MGKTLHKAPAMKEFLKSGRGDFTDFQEFEQQLKDYVRDNDIHIPSGPHGNYVTNDLQGGMRRTQELLKNDPELRRLMEQAMKKNRRDAGQDSVGPGGKGKRYPGRPNRWDEDDWDPAPGPNPGRWRPIGGHGRGGRTHWERKSLKEILFSPLGVVLAVVAFCIFLYEVAGPAMYSFIMNGPFFKILLIILAAAAVVAILKSARGWPSGVKFVVILVIGLVLLYSMVGPAIYSFLMSGALFKLICLVIAVAASIGIFKGNIGWPMGVKLVVIVIIWVVVKSEVL